MAKSLFSMAAAEIAFLVEAEARPENKAMLALFGRSGLPMKRRLEVGAVHVTLSLSAPAPG
jgi:hypothetical protein